MRWLEFLYLLVGAAVALALYNAGVGFWHAVLAGLGWFFLLAPVVIDLVLFGMCLAGFIVSMFGILKPELFKY